MRPGRAKTRNQLPWLPYPKQEQMYVINAHNFGRPWTPADIATSLWLDAADSSTLFDATSGGSLPGNGVGVARWEDKSGNGRHVTQATSGNRPIRSVGVRNSLDVIRFDGSDDRLIGTGFLTDNFSVYMVGRKRDLVINRMAWFSQNNNTFNSQRLILFSERTTGSITAAMQVGTFGSVAGSPSGVFAQWGYTRSGTTGNVFRNSTGGAVTVNSGNVQNTSLAIGAGNNADTVDCTDVDICEIVVLSSVSSTFERQRIEGYLAHKWGIQSSLPSGHPYRNNPPTI